MTNKVVFELTSDAKAINRMAGSLATRGKKWDADAHIALVSGLMHYGEHHDWTPLVAVLDAFPRSARRKAAIAWIEAFASLVWREKEKKFSQPKQVEKRFAKVDEANAIHFGDFTEEKKPQEVTLEAIIKMVKAKVKKGMTDETISEDDLGHLMGDIRGAVAEAVLEA
jgi:hypothetical protein